jgi:hypothetical protein
VPYTRGHSEGQLPLLFHSKMLKVAVHLKESIFILVSVLTVKELVISFTTG